MLHVSHAPPLRRLLAVGLISIWACSTPAAADELPPILIGQVTCSSCWTEADRTIVPYGGEADRACAARCAAAGIPPAIAVREDDGSFRLVILEGTPPSPHEDWLELIARFVRAETAPTHDERVRVTALETLDESPWPATAASNPEDLRWPDLTGTEQSISALSGRIAVVNFWATWCAPCIEEMPVLGGIQTDYGPLGVQVVGIAADGPSDSRKVLAFAREKGLTFPLWLGATTRDMASFEVGPALPATVVIDREGHVVHRTHGIVKDKDLRDVLDRLIRGGHPDEIASEHEETPERVARAPAEAALVPS